MRLLAVLILLLVQKFFPGIKNGKADQLHKSFLQKTPENLVLASVVAPSVLVAWLLLAADSLFWVLVADSLILIWACGPGGWRKSVERYSAAVEQGNMEKASKIAAEKFEVKDADSDPEVLTLKVNQRLGTETFKQFFSLIFWYAVLGGGAVLLLKLTNNAINYLQERNPDSDQCANLRSIQYGMQWPAIRFQGLVLSLVGDFETSFKHIIHNLESTPRDECEQMSGYVAAALGKKELTGSTKLLKSQMLLLERARLVWLALFAIMTLLWV